MRAYLFCTVAMLLYAGNALTGEALADLSPFVVAFVRFVVAVLVLLPLCWRDVWDARTIYRRRPWPVVLMAVSGVLLFNTLIYASLRFAPATHVSVLQTAAPAVTALAGALLIREILSRRQWAGIILAGLGAAWVATDGVVGSAALSFAWNIGHGLAVAALVSWSCYTLAVRRFADDYAGRGLLLVMTALSAVLVFPLALRDWVTGGLSVHDLNAHWLGLTYVGIFPSVVALSLYNRAVLALGASRAAAFLGLLPVFTVTGAHFFMETHIGMAVGLGMATVIGGLLLTTLGGCDGGSQAATQGPPPRR